MLIEMTGQRFGKLTVIKRVNKTITGGNAYWLCKCEPGNCRWATRKEQAQNQRTNDNITYKGETLCLTEWARKLGFFQGTLWNRLYKLGWPIDRAFEERRI